MKFKKLFLIIGILIILYVIGSQVETNLNFDKVGYFKDDLRNRIVTVTYKPGTSANEIRTYAESLMYTEGQMMAAYFYSEGGLVPADGVTLASTMTEVNDLLYETPGLSNWRYAYMRYFKIGATEFVNCEHDLDNDLCRKK